MYGFLKDENILDEVYRVEDLFDFELEKHNLHSRLSQITQPSTIGLIGGYGTGKSTLLYQLEKDANIDSDNWFVFDAWKYPERNELWENFVLDLAYHVAGNSLRTYTKAKLKGKTLGKSVLNGIMKDIGFFAKESLQAVTDYYSGDSISLDDYYRILDDIFKKYPRNLYIVLEDIDRSGDKGQYFLETLKYFLYEHEHRYESKVLFIVPIASTSYNHEDCKESYLKSLNYIIEFKPEIKSFIKLIENIIDESIIDLNSKSRLDQFLFHFSKDRGVSLRKVKQILRNANLRYIELKNYDPNIDWETVICVECLKYDEHNGQSHYDNAKYNKVINAHTLYSAYLYAMVYNQAFIRDNTMEQNIRYPSDSIKIYTIKGVSDDLHPAKPYKAHEGITLISTYFR